MNAYFLGSVIRESIDETEHWGYLSVVNEHGRIQRFGEDKKVFLRSVAKPVQLLGMLNEYTLQNINPSQEELAIAMGSHSGTEAHLNIIKGFLYRMGIDANYLLCSAHKPYDCDANDRLVREGRIVSKLHNNCSGQHSFMLACCKVNNLPLENYVHPNHPLQKQITKVMKSIFFSEDLIIGRDGCDLPVYGMPLETMTVGFYHLIKSNDANFQKIVEAITAYPYAFGGKNRIDSVIVKVTKGRLFAKVGAGGLMIVSHVNGMGTLGLKIADGNSAFRDKYLTGLLGKLGWLSADELKHEEFREFTDLSLRSLSGIIVGELKLNVGGMVYKS